MQYFPWAWPGGGATQWPSEFPVDPMSFGWDIVWDMGHDPSGAASGEGLGPGSIRFCLGSEVAWTPWYYGLARLFLLENLLTCIHPTSLPPPVLPTTQSTLDCPRGGCTPPWERPAVLGKQQNSPEGTVSQRPTPALWTGQSGHTGRGRGPRAHFSPLPVLLLLGSGADGGGLCLHPAPCGGRGCGYQFLLLALGRGAQLDGSREKTE